MSKKTNTKKNANSHYDTFDLYCFPNGRVYFLDRKILDEAIDAGKEILIVCGAWSGGYNHAIGADYQENVYEDEDGWHGGYSMYGYSIKDEVLTPEDLQKFYRVIFTSGEMIYMKTGDQATAYQGGMFIDWDSKVSDIIERQEIDIYPQKFAGGAEEIDKLRKTVDSKRTKANFIRTQDGEKKIRTLKAYRIITED